MVDFDPSPVVRTVRDDNEQIAQWLGRGSERAERVRDIKLGPIPVGERVRRISRSQDLNVLLGAAVIAGYEQAMKDLETQREGEA